jgi:hypothetical protein
VNDHEPICPPRPDPEVVDAVFPLHGNAEQIADYLGIDLFRARQVFDTIRGARNAGYESGYDAGWDAAEYTYGEE